MKLTENFTLEEMCVTLTGLENTLDAGSKEAANLRELCACVLQPLRTLYGKPIRVSSGYRSKAVNDCVGGAASSQHLKGQAADITTGSRRGNRDLFEMIIAYKLPYDVLIDELDFAWIHVSYNSEATRKPKVLHL